MECKTLGEAWSQEKRIIGKIKKIAEIEGVNATKFAFRMWIFLMKLEKEKEVKK